LLPEDGTAGDFFGISVSLDGDRALVGAYLDGDQGASGSAYVFVRDGRDWGDAQGLAAEAFAGAGGWADSSTGGKPGSGSRCAGAGGDE